MNVLQHDRNGQLWPGSTVPAVAPLWGIVAGGRMRVGAERYGGTERWSETSVILGMSKTGQGQVEVT